MFQVNEDLSIYVTRGDAGVISVSAKDKKNGGDHVFKAGDVIRFSVCEKKKCENVVLQKDFPIVSECEKVTLDFTSKDTKIGKTISKPVDYWYEVELNPLTFPQTIIAYDEEGTRIFKLFPEHRDLGEDEPSIAPEDIPIIDKALDVTSPRPVENQAVAREILRLTAAFDETKAKSDDTAAAVGFERARIDNLIAHNVVAYSKNLDYLSYITEETKAKIGASVSSDGVFATLTINLREANLFVGGSGMEVFIIPDECRPIDTGLIHTEDGVEYRISRDVVNMRYCLYIGAQNDVTYAPSGAGSVTIVYALGDYELKDIRVGADGIVYPTAGEAVRAQITKIASQLKDGNHTYNLTSYYTDSRAISVDGGVGATAPLNAYTSATHKSLMIECNEGDVFEVLGCADGDERRVYAFLDENNVILLSPVSAAKANTFTKPIKIVAPKGAVKLVSNLLMNVESYLLYLPTRLSEAEDKAKEAVSQIGDGNHIYNFTNHYTDSLLVVNKGGVGATAPLNTYASDHKSLILECKEGDTFELLGTANGGDARAYAFLDKNNVILASPASSRELNTFTEPIKIVAPKGTVKLVSNLLMDIENYLLYLPTRLSEMEDTAKDISERLNETAEAKYIVPRWAEIHPLDIKDTGYVQSMIREPYSFWHGLFESLYAKYRGSHGLEKIDVGAMYNKASGETTPSYISDIANGSIYMYHLPIASTDGKYEDFQHKKLKLVLASGIHGGEKESIYNNYLLLKEMLEGSTNRAISILRNCVDIYFIPLINVSGIESNTRNNANNINLNRDFAVADWSPGHGEGEGATSASQWETRVISYILDELKPDALIDHHTSGGDATKESTGKIMQWGLSRTAAIRSLIEENIVELTPYVRERFADRLGAYTHVYGHAETPQTYRGYLDSYAYEQGIISSTIETFQHLKWNSSEGWIFGFGDEDEKYIISISYFLYINYLMRFVCEVVRYLNGKIKF